MRKTIYRQYDSRWGSLAYPTKSYTFAKNGCGCCAVTHVVMEQNKYQNKTPKTFRSHMVSKGYATKGHGTTHAGIKATLEHYGHKVYHPGTMTEAFKIMKNAKLHTGILLFRSGKKGGVTWTSGGHYVAFTDYKVKNGKHYFYTKDSGARKNDGWHCYETQMKGLIKQIWICDVPKNGKYYTVGKTYTLQESMNVRTGAGTTYKKVDNLAKGTKVKCLQTSKTGKWIRIGENRWVCGRGVTKVYIK